LHQSQAEGDPRSSWHDRRKILHGDFTIPMFIHDTMPPGAETMKRLSKKISYLIQNTAQGVR
jgi:hypothetical protein